VAAEMTVCRGGSGAKGLVTTMGDGDGVGEARAAVAVAAGDGMLIAVALGDGIVVPLAGGSDVAGSRVGGIGVEQAERKTTVTNVKMREGIMLPIASIDLANPLCPQLITFLSRGASAKLVESIRRHL